MNEITENLADKINAAFAEATTLAADAKDKTVAAVEKALECGRLMLAQKQTLQQRSGKERCGWIEWLAENCPQISEQTARRYMALAKRSHVSGYLENCSTLRQAYLATGIIKEEEKPESNSPTPETPWVRYTKPLDSFRHWYNSRIEKEPMDQWQEDMLRILANELQWFVNLYNDIQRVRDAIAENQEDQ
jgi:hypothetical protein